MNSETVQQALRQNFVQVDLQQLSIADLTGMAILEVLQRAPGAMLATVQGNCTVPSVDDAAPPTGWQCKCFANGGITAHSFAGPGFPSWAAGGGGWRHQERHAAIHGGRSHYRPGLFRHHALHLRRRRAG